ncbi:MAG: class I SAM-dependent methyltransferase, partial [bacterium]
MNLKSHSNYHSEKIRLTYYAGIFLISLSTLLLEFSLTRVLSVSLWYHFAFMVISVALLGFGISGVLLSLSKKLNTINPEKLLSILSICYGSAVVISFILINKIPFDPFSLLSDPIQFLYLPVYYILITIPFFFAGLIISILLTRFKNDISKLYFFDLIGAGSACVAFVLIIPMAGGNGGVVFVAAIAFVAAIVFSFQNYKTISFVSFIMLVITLTFLINSTERFPINVTVNKIYGNYIKDRPDLKVRTEWNTFSKIDVMKDEEKAEDGYDIYLAIIDAGNATTNIPNVKSLPLTTKPADASNLAFATKDSAGKVFIIGSAGGGEILTGLYHNAKNITAVEINGVLNDLIQSDLSYWTGPLIRNNKKVNLITDDARSVLSSKRISYDVIISAHTISASAVSSGAMGLVENYILTKEAVKEYLNHLEPGGVLYISRPETQLPKIITTLKEARFENSGGLEDSKKNFIIFRRPPNNFENEKSFLAGVLYKKDGFNAEDIINVRNEASSLSMEILYDPLSTQESIYKKLIESENIYEEVKNYDKKIEPATDDKPFFDQNIGFANLSWKGVKETFSQDDKAILALKDKPVAETTLLAILIQCFLIAGLLILLPLKFFRKEDVKKNSADEF